MAKKSATTSAEEPVATSREGRLQQVRDRIAANHAVSVEDTLEMLDVMLGVEPASESASAPPPVE